MLDTHPAVAAAAVAGTAVLNADLNRLSWRDFRILIPGTVVVASLMLLAMLRFRWRTTLAVLVPVGLTTAALVAAMLLRDARSRWSRSRCPDSSSPWACPSLHVVGLDCHLAPGRARHRRDSAT